MRNERIVVSRQRLLDEVWGYVPVLDTNTIEVFGLQPGAASSRPRARPRPAAHDPGSRLVLRAA